MFVDENVNGVLSFLLRKCRINCGATRLSKCMDICCKFRPGTQHRALVGLTCLIKHCACAFKPRKKLCLLQLDEWTEAHETEEEEKKRQAAEAAASDGWTVVKRKAVRRGGLGFRVCRVCRAFPMPRAAPAAASDGWTVVKRTAARRQGIRCRSAPGWILFLQPVQDASLSSSTAA